MARIRPRAHASADPGTVAGRPLSAPVEPPPDDAIDDLAGVEAFGPRPEGDPDDPLRALADDRRPLVAEGQEGLARFSLLVAVAVCVIGLVALALGVVDDDDELDAVGDDVATVATTSTTTARRGSTTTTSTAPTSTTTPGLTPGTTPTSQPRATVTTVRTSTSLPAPTSTTLDVDEPLEVRIELLDEDRNPLSAPVAGQRAIVRVTSTDADAEPTEHCQRISINQSVVIDDEGCEPRDCPAALPPGGERILEFGHTFLTAGSYTIRAELESGYAECDDPGASTGSGSLQVDVN